MGKDPAVLFYTSDFISGTLTMTNEQRGKYILLLCLQHQKGRLSKEDMKNICKTYDKEVYAKFVKDKSGNYYNQRMESESIKRKEYSHSRSLNRSKKETYLPHMEDENKDVDINIIKDSNKTEEIEMAESLEEHLLKFWGRDGRQGYGIMTQFVDLMKKHTKEKVFEAIETAGRYNKKSYAYVLGILEPKDPKTEQDKELEKFKKLREAKK
jgi:uncharacterized protein YdaU (DUF1376 family)